MGHWPGLGTPAASQAAVYDHDVGNLIRCADVDRHFGLIETDLQDHVICWGQLLKLGLHDVHVLLGHRLTHVMDMSVACPVELREVSSRGR